MELSCQARDWIELRQIRTGGPLARLGQKLRKQVFPVARRKWAPSGCINTEKERQMTTNDLRETTIAKLPQATNGSLRVSELLRQYGCGPIPFVGTENAFYERHLIFDRVIDPGVATARERFEAFAHSIRDTLAQRWVLTRKTYERENPKRIYY
jgi:hypothetical protein